MYKKIKDNRKNIAKERINKLFELVLNNPDNELFNERYISLARKISNKYNVSIPNQFKRLFCKKCNSLMLNSKKYRIRLKKNNIVYSCFNCKNIYRLKIK